MRYTSTPLMKSLSSDEGKTWSKPVVSPLWSVYANVIHLPNDVLVASSGKPGIGLWVSADGLGEEWKFHNIAAIHNGLLPRPCPIGRNGASAMGYHPSLANISSCNGNTAGLSPPPVAETPGGVCIDVGPAMTTGYTGLAAVPSDSSNSSVVVLTYDRLSNGWAGPSAKGAWGDTDMVFSMRVHISRYD
jgi:hypothetical protein